MKFPQLIEGRFIKRYKRFFVDILLADGSIVVAHCPNTGSMRGLFEDHARVWISPSTNPKRKLKFTWELVEIDQQYLVCIQTNRANAVVKEAIEAGLISELSGYHQLQTEKKYGSENSRIDLFLSGHAQLTDAYVEVKNVSLLENGQGFFPDAVTSRGQKHLRELQQVVAQGQRGILLFHVAHSAIKSVQAAAHIDPEYAQLLSQAAEAGVEVLAYQSLITPKSINLLEKLPVNIS